MRTPMLSLAVLLATGALVVAGCGGSNDNSSNDSKSGGGGSTSKPASSSSGGGGSQLKLSADPGGALKFNKSSLSAKAGRVTIVMDNPSSLQHAVAVEGNGVDKDGSAVGHGGTSTVSVSLKPGKYEFYCPVDGHKAAGMKGELTVQ